MGGKQSKKGVDQTPLQCMLKNFKKGFSRDYGDPKPNPAMLKRFCESEWVALGVGWPKKGSANPELVARVHQIVTGNGYWDQYPYIDQWQINIAQRPRWLAKCQIECAKIYLASQKAKPQTKAKIFSQEDREEMPRPPPYVPRREEGRINQQIPPPPLPEREAQFQPEAGEEGKIATAGSLQETDKSSENTENETTVSSRTRTRKVFRNRDKEEERKSDQKEKKKAEMLAVALGGMNIGPNQCAICKQEGHWQRECPQRNGQPRGQSRQYGRGRGRGFRGTFQRSYRGSFKGRGHPAYPNQTEEREENMIGLADMEWED